MARPTELRSYGRQSIAWRLGFGLSLLLVAIGLVSIASLSAIFDIHERLHVLKNDEERARTVVEVAGAVRDQYAHVAHTIILGDDSHAKLFRDATERIEALAASLRGRGGPATDVGVDRVVAASQQISALFESEVLPLVRAGDRGGLVAHHDRIMSLAVGAQADAEKIAHQVEAAMDDLNRHVRATEHGAIRLTIVAHVAALLTAIIVGLFLYRTIARPIAKLAAAAARVGVGDFESPIAIERDDELGRLSKGFNDMVQAMKDHQKKLLQSERLVGLASMSAAIAHEINNPIGVILGYVKLLRRRPDTFDPKVLAAIEEEAERCHQVIEGLLELTRGRVLHTGRVDLRALADDVVARVRMTKTPAELAIYVHGHAAVEADESKLRQVLTNLVSNAVESCGSRGRVAVLIDTPRVGFVTVEIHDTGAGIDPAVRDRIFEPFFTTKTAGSGLGLAISRAIARAHDGDLTLLSSTNRGTQFRLTLPCKPEMA